VAGGRVPDSGRREEEGKERGKAEKKWEMVNGVLVAVRLYGAIENTTLQTMNDVTFFRSYNSLVS
jgi:hypothetical protein